MDTPAIIEQVPVPKLGPGQHFHMGRVRFTVARVLHVGAEPHYACNWHHDSGAEVKGVLPAFVVDNFTGHAE